MAHSCTETRKGFLKDTFGGGAVKKNMVPYTHTHTPVVTLAIELLLFHHHKIISIRVDPERSSVPTVLGPPAVRTDDDTLSLRQVCGQKLPTGNKVALFARNI